MATAEAGITRRSERRDAEDVILSTRGKPFKLKFEVDLQTLFAKVARDCCVLLLSLVIPPLQTLSSLR